MPTREFYACYDEVGDNTVEVGPTVLTVDAGGDGLDIFSFVHHFSILSPFLWETVRY